MTTATKTKTTKPSPLAKIKAAEAAWAKAQDAASEASREHSERMRLTQGLTDERRRLAHHDPELVNYKGQPAKPDNAIAKIDLKLAKLDVDDAAARVNHARELERVARQRFEDLVRAHGDALDAKRRPEGEALLAEYVEKAAALAEVSERILGFGKRSFELAHIRQIDTRRIPIDGAANTARLTRQLADSPPALPIQPTELG